MDRAAYMSYLETQLERVTASCNTVQVFKHFCIRFDHRAFDVSMEQAYSQRLDVIQVARAFTADSKLLTKSCRTLWPLRKESLPARRKQFASIRASPSRFAV